MGYCPFESRYNGLYHDTGQLGAVAWATTRSDGPRYNQETSHDTARKRVETSDALRDERRARTGGLAAGTQGTTRRGASMHAEIRPERPTTRLAKLATRRRVLLLGRSARGLCAQAGLGCAPDAPDSVLTQDAVLSHCLDHCS